MRFLRALVLLLPIWILVTAESSPSPTSPSPPASASPSASPSPTPTPPPTPTPVNAFLSLDVTAGDANTVINVSGGQFLPNEQLTLYWDTAGHVAGSATADANGSFNTRIKPFSGDPPGVHHVCASVQPNPCANFTINAPLASPSPSPTPSESPSPSPTATVTETPSSTPVAATLNGFDVISRPPFVFLPIAGVVAIGLALGFWLFSVLRRPRQMTLTSAAVVHRAMRPDYSAGFGTPPPAPDPQSELSAWDQSPVHPPPAQAAQPVPPAAPVTHPPEAPPAESQMASVEWGPPVEWGTGSSDWGFPEPPPSDDLPDPPQPGD
jgi:hypothetical protein